MAFINGLWRTETPILKEIEILKLNKNQIEIKMYNSLPFNSDYKFNFMITPKIGDMIGKKIDLPSLKNAILDKIGEDARYFSVYNLEPGKCELLFDYKTWIIDAFKTIVAKNDFSTFSRSYRFTKQLPLVIRTDLNRHYFAPFFARKFKEYLRKEKAMKNFLETLIPDFVMDKMKNAAEHVLDYTFDFQSNSFRVGIKPEFIAPFVYTANQMITHTKGFKMDLNFEKEVQKNIDMYTKNKKTFKTLF